MWKMFCSQAERDMFYNMLNDDPRQVDCDSILGTYLSICCPQVTEIRFCEADRAYADMFIFWLSLTLRDKEEFEKAKARISEFWASV